MTEIKIHKNISPSKIDSLYREFIVQKKMGEDIVLTLPAELNKYRFGVFSDLLRFIITLNIKSNIVKVIFDVEQNELESLYKQEYSYPIISLLWNKAIFQDKNLNLIKDDLRIKQNEFFHIMNSLHKFKGPKYLLCHTDHLSKNNGLIKFLEDSNGFNDDELYINNVIKRILIENVLTFNKNNSEEIQNVIDDISAIVYELAKNTYEWGKTDSSMNPIKSSIRGIYFRFHNNSYNKMKEDFVDTPIENFINHKYIKNSCIQLLDKIYYLEILVYDSGVGFIEKFNDSQGLNGIDIIKKCLIKNQTSSTSNFKSKKGLGLDRILSILDKKGFLRIITDKYSVYRDLIKDNYTTLSQKDLKNLKLDDWNKNDFNTDDEEKCQGSFVSILYPFKKVNN
ncbi:hypothetical protein [Chryseobacterium sp.]|uniref:hypothetical protein n=1 Tax=Chryseobacterium sp. TaxID=1871047 RepID=UPI00289B6C7B|nr:hypothetical protein [Chryseobacterium sp.]